MRKGGLLLPLVLVPISFSHNVATRNAASAKSTSIYGSYGHAIFFPPRTAFGVGYTCFFYFVDTRCVSEPQGEALLPQDGAGRLLVFLRKCLFSRRKLEYRG